LSESHHFCGFSLQIFAFFRWFCFCCPWHCAVAIIATANEAATATTAKDHS